MTEQLSTNIRWCLSFRGWLANWCWLLSGDLASSLLDATILTAWQLAPSKVNNPKEQGRDFPGGPGVKNLPAKAADRGLILDLGTKILHASGRLSPCTNLLNPCTLEPVHRNYWTPEPNYWNPLPRACALQQDKPRQREACTPQLGSSPTTRGSLHTAAKTQCCQK